MTHVHFERPRCPRISSRGVVAGAVGWLVVSCMAPAGPGEPNDSGGDGAGIDGQIGGGGEKFELPAGFTPTDRGGFRRGEEIEEGGLGPGGAGGAGGAENEPCDSVVLAVVRDFRRGDEGPDGHPDFQTFSGTEPSPGIVKSRLGEDGKPIASTEGPFLDPGNGPQTSGRERFEEWFRSVPGVNRSYLLELAFAPNEGLDTFESKDFFPLDGAGFGHEGLPHNYHFTTELHVRFRYKAGDEFTFTGDDDLWVFIADELVIDLGGLHAEATRTVALDEVAGRLGLVIGEEYPLDLFHAERGVVDSNFRVDTNLDLTSCRLVNVR